MEEGETDEKTFFICEVCNEMFNDKTGLDSHRQEKHVIKTYKCAVCVTYFQKHEHLLEHMQNHVAVFLFKCQNCGKTFSNITDLRLHMEEHVVMKKYVCCLCTDRFGNIDIFQLHLKRVHDIKPKASENQDSATTYGKIQIGAENVIACKEYKCEFCDSHFENDQLLFSHVKDHAKCQQKDQLYPKLAENILIEESNLNFKIAEVTSVSNVTGNSDTSVLVQSPSSKKSNKAQGNTLVFVHKTDKGNFLCQLCQKTFAFQENLLLHLKTHPSVEGSQPSVQTSVIQSSPKPYTYKKDQFPCLKCNESFAFEENLHLHLKTHEGDLTPSPNKKSMMQCDECGIFILDPQEFSLHLKRHQDFQCAKCGGAFSDPLEFDTHERLHLLSDLACDICQEQFESKDALNLHRKIRHEKKTLMCGVCGEVFGNDELKEHMKAHSKSTKTDKCDICNEMVLKSKFEAHMEMHEISDFYYCDVCDDEFDCEEEFQIHLSSHLICKICKKLFNLQSQLDQHMLSHNQNCTICDLTFDTLEQLKEHESSRHVENETETTTKEESQIEIEKQTNDDETIEPGEEMKVLAVADPSFSYSNAFSHDHGGLACRSHDNKGLESKISNSDTSIDAGISDATLSNQPNANKPSTGGKVGIPFKAKITCEYCSRRFRYTLAYENHLKDHPKQCKVCGEIFRKLANLRVHERSHVLKVDKGTLAPQFIIHTRSGKEFSTEAEMIEDQTTHAGTTTEEENKRTTPSQISEVESNMIIRVQDIKKEPEDQPESMINDKLPVKCGLDDEDDMKDHLTSIHNCNNNVSNISFNDITERKIHQDTHFPSSPILRCSYDFCGVKFESQNDLNEHVKSHNIEPKVESLSIPNVTPSSIPPGTTILRILNKAPVSNEPQTCEQGDQTTLGEDQNVREVQDDQSLIEKKPLDVVVSLNCELCSTSVGDETEMKRHMETSHKNITFRCDVCFILFSTRELYDSHRRTHFERKNSFVCRAKRCTARFSTSSALNEHAQGHVLKHSTKKSLSDAIAAKKRRREMGVEKRDPVIEKKLMICEICDERFLNYEIREIQLHEEKHRLEDMKTKSESVLKCELCSQIMRNEKELLTHMGTVHKGIKFRCEVCLTLLSSKPELDRHKKTHIPHYGLIKKCSVRLKRLSSELT